MVERVPGVLLHMTPRVAPRNERPADQNRRIGLRRAITLWLCLSAIALGVVATAPAAVRAHAMPKSLVMLDLAAHGVHAELHLPLDRLEIGVGLPLLSDPRERVNALRATLVQYVGEHISVTSPDGTRWQTRVTGLELADEVPAHELIVRVSLDAPADESPRTFTLHYDVIQHQLITHVALVSLRHDWNAGLLDGAPEMLGAMGYNHDTLVVDRPAGSAMRGFTSMVRLGVRHVADGTDHLLFLLVLLLPSALVARGGRWGEYAGAGRSVRHLVGIVTAFTIGHSITLALGALNVVRAPGALVETLIAISILVSAVHALRPLFPGRESIIAAGFGLVHGMAFSTVVAELGLGGWQMGLAVFGFNIGIEFMQLAVVVITMPWLLMLACTSAYRALRVIGAVFAGVASVGWIGERALGLYNPIEPWVEWSASNALWIVGMIAAAAMVVTVRQRLTAPDEKRDALTAGPDPSLSISALPVPSVP